jgi:hypothetical protein
MDTAFGVAAMKWFKHMSDASNDELVAHLEAELGHTGYALWYKILEIVAAQMKPTDPPRLSLPVSKWCLNLRVNKKKLNSFLVLTQMKHKINFVYNENILSIEIPKLLEIRDNSTANLQATNKRMANKEVEEEGDTDQKKKVPLPEPKQKDASVSRKPKTQRIGFDFQTRKFTGIVPADIAQWKEAYPALDVVLVLKAMAVWLVANPDNKKTAYSKFITNWLKREQDKAPRVNGAPRVAQTPAKPTINDILDGEML